jgi:hypothetical protein
MDFLVAAFPWLVFLACVAVAIVWFRLDRRLGRGARGPGPQQPHLSTPPGLARTPWELQTVHQSLLAPPGSAARVQLITTLNSLLESGNQPLRLHPGDGNDRVELAVAMLEQRLAGTQSIALPNPGNPAAPDPETGTQPIPSETA